MIIVTQIYVEQGQKSVSLIGRHPYIYTESLQVVFSIKTILFTRFE